MHTVFVSHAHADNALCDRYVAALRERGLDVWYDRTNLQDGRMLSTEIERELEHRSAFVVLLTPASVASYWVNLETSAYRSLAAQDATRLMLPVRIAECKVPLLMAGIKWVDAVSLGFDATVEAVGVVLGAPSAPTALATPTESVDDLIAHGKKLVARQKYAKALPFFEHATQRDPRNFAAWVSLGYANGKLGRFEEALAAFDRALALDPQLTGAWIGKGAALGALGRFEEALMAWDRALELGPEDANTWNNKGIALGRLGRTLEAEDAWHRADKLGFQG